LPYSECVDKTSRFHEVHFKKTAAFSQGAAAFLILSAVF
jgi:hypothetical protein